MDKDQWEPVQEPDVDVDCVTSTPRPVYLTLINRKIRLSASSSQLLRTAGGLVVAAPAKAAGVMDVATDVVNVSGFPIMPAYHL